MAQRSSDVRGSDEHDASQSAALVALNLISSARVILKLDSVYTEYSAQYVVENASLEKEGDGQGGSDLKLTVKDCLEFALKEGIPRADAWPHLGCVIKTPSVYKPALVSTKGEVIEGKKLEDAFDMLEHQPVGAKLHVFSPDIDLLGENGIYDGMTRNDSCYVGLRDVIIVCVKKIKGEPVADVKICYKKKVSFIKVNLSRMFMQLPRDGEDASHAIGPTGLLVDFCVPRLSIN